MMKCENILFHLETGNIFHKAIARRHVARCDECARVVESFARARIELTRGDQLDPKHHEIWRQACGPLGDTVPAQRARFAIPVVVVAVVMAAIALMIWTNSNDPSNGIEVVSETNDILEAPLDVTGDLENLEDQLALLEEELDQLDHDAELVDPRRLANQILAEFDVW